jgi:hypothetical protein
LHRNETSGLRLDPDIIGDAKPAVAPQRRI